MSSCVVFTSNCLIIDLKISLKIFRQTFTMLTFHLADIGHYNDGPNWCSSANCGGMHTCLPLRMSLSAYGFKLAFLCQVHMFPKNVCQYHPEQIVVSLPLMGSLSYDREKRDIVAIDDKTETTWLRIARDHLELFLILAPRSQVGSAQVHARMHRLNCCHMQKTCHVELSS